MKEDRLARIRGLIKEAEEIADEDEIKVRSAIYTITHALFILVAEIEELKASKTR